MRVMRLEALGITLFAAFLACVALPASADAVRSAIEAANQDFTAAVAKGDSARLATLYAADAQVLAPGSDIVEGTPAIQKFWQSVFDSGIAAMTLTTTEVFGHGPTATEVGRYELRDKADKVLDHGKYIVVWRQDSGRWKLLRDMFSTNVAPSAQK